MLLMAAIEMTFVGESDYNRCFSRGGKGSARSLSVLDDSIYDCHAGKSREKVRKIIEAFRAGVKDCVSCRI